VQDKAGYRYDRIIVHTLSAVLMLAGLIGSEIIGRALTIRPLLLLGRLSFPIYLFHFPLLCSLGCYLFLMLQPTPSYAITLAVVAIIYLPIVLAVAVVFARVDEVWAAWVNRGTDRLLSWGIDRRGTRLFIRRVALRLRRGRFTGRRSVRRAAVACQSGGGAPVLATRQAAPAIFRPDQGNSHRPHAAHQDSDHGHSSRRW
jgi:peptidoglycan/LPS O-acetylase OafA/YrhL